MTPLFRYITPILGTKGIYSFSHDFKVSEGEILECIGIRTISDYLANAEDPYQEIYVPVDLPEGEYENDLKADIGVVSLRNDGGYVYKVPARFIASYPIQDGIGYHSVTLPCALPAIRVDQDLTVAVREIKSAIKSSLGVDAVISVVQTSNVRGVNGTTDERIQIERQLIIDNNISTQAQLAEKDRLIDELNQRLAVLEAYIIANAP